MRVYLLRHDKALKATALQPSISRIKSTRLSQAKPPFIIHPIISTFASLTFIFRPAAQLSSATSSTNLILQCYGGLILFTNLIALVVLTRPFDETPRLIALAFAFWHCWRTHRPALWLIYVIEAKGELGRTLGGPTVHLSIHGVLIATFLWSGLVA